MDLTSQKWHRRFIEQAGWTRDLREHLYSRAGLPDARQVLDAGCGTGVLFEELLRFSDASVYGLDLNRSHLAMAAKNYPQIMLVEADAHQLPIAHEFYDIVLCHYFLLWVADPALVLVELARVLRHGGALLILAEPDYGGRIDHPPALQKLGFWQAQSLRSQGADPEMGRQLAGLMNTAGFETVEFGVLGGQWDTPSSAPSSTEWEMLLSDMGELTVSESDIKELKKIDALAWENGERVLFVPTFYAWGKKA